jgi:hypothetical protein
MHRLQHLGITFIRRKAWFPVDQTLLLFELSARDKRQDYTPQSIGLNSIASQ